MIDEEKFLNVFRTTLPVLIDKEMAKIRRQQRGVTFLLGALMGVNILMLGTGLWMLLHENSDNVVSAPAQQQVAGVPSTSVETVDVFADLRTVDPAKADGELKADEEPTKAEEEPTSSDEESTQIDEEPTKADEESAEERIKRSNEAISRSLKKVKQSTKQSTKQNVKQKRRKANTNVVSTKTRRAKRVETTTLPDFVITKSGMTLRSLAHRYYGNEVFWVCIYDHNSRTLRNPNVLPKGIRLRLPRPSDYGIDANDPSSLRRAKALASTLGR